MKRRDIFINVAKPGHGDEARKYLGEWLRSLNGHPGYLGGSVLDDPLRPMPSDSDWNAIGSDEPRTPVSQSSSRSSAER